MQLGGFLVAVVLDQRKNAFDLYAWADELRYACNEKKLVLYAVMHTIIDAYNLGKFRTNACKRDHRLRKDRRVEKAMIEHGRETEYLRRWLACERFGIWLIILGLDPDRAEQRILEIAAGHHRDETRKFIKQFGCLLGRVATRADGDTKAKKEKEKV